MSDDPYWARRDREALMRLWGYRAALALAVIVPVVAVWLSSHA